jgi:hypothetical protein
MKYFVFSKKKRNTKPTVKKTQVMKGGLSSQDQVMVSLSGKIAAMRETLAQLETYKKPTKQLVEITYWAREYEKELYKEWNTRMGRETVSN